MWQTRVKRMGRVIGKVEGGCMIAENNVGEAKDGADCRLNPAQHFPPVQRPVVGAS